MKFSSRFRLMTLIGGLTLTGLIALIISSVALADQGVNLCTKTSHDTLKACNYGVKDDYWLAIGKCDNLPTKSERKACGDQALQNMKSGFEECKTQFAARQEICKTLGGDAYNPIINPADFVSKVDNPYFPLTPGTTFIYEGITEKGNEHVEVYVTHDRSLPLVWPKTWLKYSA